MKSEGKVAFIVSKGLLYFPYRIHQLPFSKRIHLLGSKIGVRHFSPYFFRHVQDRIAKMIYDINVDKCQKVL